MKICCPCNGNQTFSFGSDAIFCPGCKTFQHKDCITPCDEMETYICPTCQLWKTDLYMKKIRNVLPPKLFDEHLLRRKKELKFYFTPDFSFFPSKTGNRPNYLVIRCLQLTPEGFKLSLPLTCEVKINNKIIVKKTTFNENFILKPILMWLKEMPQSVRTPYRKKPLPIKNYINDKQENVLSLTMEKTPNKISKYILSIDYVSYRERIEDVIESTPKISNIEDIKNLLTRKNELNLISKVPLVDNYTTVDEVKMPIRGLNCLHIQAFDLYKFIQLNKDILKYRCPICNKKSNIFYIDMYLKSIIGKYYKENKKFVFMNENLKVDEDYKEEIKEDNDMMEIDEDCIEDIDNGEEDSKIEDNYLEEGELPNEEVVEISDSSESEAQRDIDVESMMMNEVEEDESNDEPSNKLTVDTSYTMEYKKRIDKTVFIYKNEIMSILNKAQ